MRTMYFVSKVVQATLSKGLLWTNKFKYLWEAPSSKIQQQVAKEHKLCPAATAHSYTEYASCECFPTQQWDAHDNQ